MDENYKKIIAFMLKIIFKLSNNQNLSDNDLQSLENIMADLNVDELDEKEFRY